MTDFNPKDEFKAAKSFRYGGRAVMEGPIDKSKFEARHLPTLVKNGHLIAMTDEEAEEFRAARRGGTVPAITREPGSELTNEQKAKVAQLVADNSKEQLIELAKTAEIADPEKLGNKPDIAEAIVRKG